MTTRFSLASNGKNVRLCWMVVLLGCLPSLTGCGARTAPPLKKVPAKGVVLFREKPLANARVNLYAPGATFPVFGDTNEAGEFEIKGGAVVGLNKITVILSDAGAATTFMPDPTKLGAAPTPGPAKAERPKQEAAGIELPKVYGDILNTPLSLTLKPEGDLAIKLELK